MRPLIVTEFITLDGVVEAPGGEPTHPHAGWTMAFGVPELFAFKLKETLEAESLPLGRTTYEGFKAAWPPQEGEFAEKMNAMPKHVVTSSGEPLEWNSIAITGEVATEVRTIKEMEGGPILVAGSATLVATLLSEGLVDELRLMVFPVMIGGGLKVFPERSEKVSFELVDLVRYDSGVTLQIFRPLS